MRSSEPDAGCWACENLPNIVSLHCHYVANLQVHEELPAFLASLLPVWDGSKTHQNSIVVFEHNPASVRCYPAFNLMHTTQLFMASQLF